MRHVLSSGVLLVFLAASLGAQPDPGKGGPDPASFRQAKVERGDLAHVLSADGVLRPERVANLRPRTGGTIEKVFVREGAAVKAGQVLVQLDARGQELALEAAKVQTLKAKADLNAAEAQHRQAEANFERARRLLEMKAAGAEEVAQARAALDLARSRIEDAKVGVLLAELTVRRAQLDLEATRILAPFAGVVLESNANLGELVGAGERLLLLADPATLLFRAVLDAREARDVKPGAVLQLGSVVAKVERIAPLWRDGEEFPRLAVEARVPNPDGKLTAFQRLTATIPLGKHEGMLKVPAAALQWRPLPEEVERTAREAYREYKYDTNRPSGSGLLVLLVEGRLRPVKVEIIATAGNVAAIQGPLKEGDTVIVGRKGLE